MAIKNLLVAFNGSETSKNALGAALLMQQKYDAHITGILAHEGKRDRFSQHQWVPENVRGILNDAIQQNVTEVEAQFYAQAGPTVQTEKLHWISLSGQPDHTVSQYACMFDFTLIGKHDNEVSTDIDLHPETITLKSGRPVLIVPSKMDKETMAKTAVLAWDGRRSATRALNDAMLILETKQNVDVVSFGQDIRPPLDGVDVVSALQRHDVPASRIRRPAASRNVGQDSLNDCHEVDAGLLIMGAFERSLLREEIFGGPTKFILENATLPVLLAH